MGTKHILILTFLTAQVLCQQKNSLTFVIDDTSSMRDDIKQVRSAAKSIIDIVLHEKASQIEDIVVVTFNDPTFGFRHRTRNEVELKQALDRIEVHGGGDCVEMSLSGIKVALEESQPGSYLFVFSDATAKDYRKFDEIKALSHEKQSQIVFVLTGDCGSLTSPDGHVYYKIAAATNGQVFRISKGEVGQVLEYVKETIKGDRTVITSRVVPPRQWTTVHFNIDDKTEYALVSASGSNVWLIIRNQFDKEITGSKVTWTRNVKALKLVGLRPGAYKAMVYGSSDVNVMVFGRTDFNFNFGFSSNVQNSLKYTERQPTQGTATHLIISVKDDEHSVNIQNVEILDMNERVIQTLPLSNVEGNVYATTKFIPPNTMFKVAVTAAARSTGKPIRRIANTPVEPIKPAVVAPEISDTEKILKAKEGEKVNIYCRIRKGKPKPHVTWYFKQRGATQFQLLADETDDVLVMNNVPVGATGEYQCVAENVAGGARHIVQLEVFGLPAFDKSPTVLEVKQSANVDIQCKISKGNPPPKITWQFKTETGEFSSIDNIGEHMRIFNVQLSNSGFYKCEAKNDVGSAQQVIQVVVLVNPEFEDSPAKITEKENTPVTLNCKLRKGNPRPKITWYFQASGLTTFTTLRNSGEELRLPAVQLKDAGEYKCVAENRAGRDEKTMLVTVFATPEIDRSAPAIIRVKENATISIPCRLTNGFPKPTITWWYKNTISTEYTAIPNVNTEALRVDDMQLVKAGHYKCVARNDVGQTDKDVEVIVEAPARIVFIPPNSRFYEGVEGDVVMRLPCTTVGFPKPSVSWIVDKVVVGQDKSRSLYVENDVLYLKNPLRSHSSNYTENITHTYVCHAVNDFGEDEKSYEVTVSEFPDYDPGNTDEKYAHAKKPYDLKCPLLYTDPNTVRWFYNSMPLNKTGPSLHFDDHAVANSGNYTCRVSDLNGAASYTTIVLFMYPPSASRLVYNFEWNGGEDAVTCKASNNLGFSTKYEWFYNGKMFKQAYTDQLAMNPIGWGQYICRVSNPLGTLNITYNIFAKDCVINRSMAKMPLLLDMSFAWPSLISKNQQYQIIRKSEKLNLICQDESPKNLKNPQSGNNSFMKFPNTKSIIATCDHEDLFNVDGVSYKFSELSCKNEVSSSVLPTKECLGSDTKLMSVGFNVDGFLDVYKSCMDTKKNVVLYTEVTTTDAGSLEDTEEPEGPCKTVAECCYESVQLVNAADVSPGPAEKATMRKQLNTVPYCKPNDEIITSWHGIETQVRLMSSQYRLTVWSGAVNYTTVDNLLVPQYLWKVVKDVENEDIIAIVHSNEQKPTASVCESVCGESSWFESYGSRTYCCKIDEFKKIFNLTIDF